MRRLAVALLALAALAAGCRKKEPLSPNLGAANKVAMHTVTLYFEGPDMLLAPERRNVALPENRAGAMSVVVRELFKGSANSGVPPLFPADTVVRGAFLLPDGNAFVDLGGPTLSAGWGTGSHDELMALQSLAQTVSANFAEVKKVRLLINGETAGTLAGHIALDRAITPMPGLVSAR